MNQIPIAFFASIIICAIPLRAIPLCFAQQLSAESSAPETQSPPPQQTSPTSTQPEPARIATGSVIPAELTKTVDAKKAKTGDEVIAKVTQDLRDISGAVVVPKDTRVFGHVTEAQPRNKVQKESQLGIEFDKAVLKNGTPMTIPMSIQAIVAPPTPNNGQSSQTTHPAGQPIQNTSSASGAGGGRVIANMPTVDDSGSTASSSGSDRPPITGNTKGVIGIPNLSLAAPNASQGSVMTSEKNNVKLDEGTLLLLRVNQ